jgi:hypothetical protein
VLEKGGWPRRTAAASCKNYIFVFLFFGGTWVFGPSGPNVILGAGNGRSRQGLLKESRGGSLVPSGLVGVLSHKPRKKPIRSSLHRKPKPLRDPIDPLGGASDWTRCSCATAPLAYQEENHDGQDRLSSHGNF